MSRTPPGVVKTVPSLKQLTQKFLVENLSSPDASLSAKNLTSESLFESVAAITDSELAHLDARGNFIVCDTSTGSMVDVSIKDGEDSFFKRARLTSYDGTGFQVRIDHEKYPEFWLEIRVELNGSLRVPGTRLVTVGRISGAEITFDLKIPPYFEPRSFKATAAAKPVASVSSYDIETGTSVIYVEGVPKTSDFWLEVKISEQQLNEWIAHEQQ